MIGRVDQSGRALVTVEITSNLEPGGTKTEVWIDTGFTGDLVLPESLIQRLGLEVSGSVDGRPIGYEVVEKQMAKMTDELAAASRVLRAQTIERTNADIKQRIGVRRFGVATLKRAKNFLALTVFVLNVMTLRRLLGAEKSSQTTA